MSRAVKIIAAAAVGFVAGVLLAPKSGEETRKDIKNKSLEAKKYAGVKARQAKTVAREATATVKKSAANVADEATGMLNSARGAAERVAGEATKLGDEAKTRGNRVADEAKHASSHVQKNAERRLK